MHSCRMLVKSRFVNNVYRLNNNHHRLYRTASVCNITKVSGNFVHDNNSRIINTAYSTQFLSNTHVNHLAGGARLYCTGRRDDESDGDGVSQRNRNEDEFNTQLPATVAVPEVWPHVPVIAINRNLVFPRFIKLIEVTISK